MTSIPEDSVLRRHYLASQAQRQARASTPSRPQAAPVSTAAPQSGGILGFFKRLFGG